MSATCCTGDLGMSVSTNNPVAEDLARVFPATLEMATIGIVIGVLLGVPMGVLAAAPAGKLDRPGDPRVRLCSAIRCRPSGWGWWGSRSSTRGWAGSRGRGGVDVFYDGLVAPVTGLLLVDSLLAGETDVFCNALSHIVLPAHDPGLLLRWPTSRG